MITKNINNENLNSAFIENLRNGYPLKPRLMVNGAELSCVIDEITVEKGNVGGDAFEIGCAVGDILTATLRDVEIEIKGKRLDYQLGMLIDGDYEYISLGVFNISEAPRSRNIVNVTAYSSIIFDTGTLFDKALLQGTLLSDIIATASSQLHSNIIVDAGIKTDVPVANMPPEMTLYQTIQFIAFLCCGYAVNDNLGNIVISQFKNEPNLDVDGTLMTTLPAIEEQPFIIDSIGCEIISYRTNNDGEEEQYSEYYALKRGKLITHSGDIITDHNANEFVVTTQTDIENAVLKISSDFINKQLFGSNWPNVLGYQYYPATIELAIGDPRLEAVDVLNVTDVDGMQYTVPCHRITHRYRGNFTSTITSAKSTLEDREIATSLPISSRLEKIERTAATYDALQYATDLIRGGLGGYVVMTPGENGYPEEILIMDTPDINTAVNVWRFNKGGLGHSHSGYDGPFNDIALTSDGKINASMITTGILDANLIRAGVISDYNGHNKWNLNIGELITNQGVVGPFSISQDEATIFISRSRRLNFTGFGLFKQTKVASLTDTTNYISSLSGHSFQFYGHRGDGEFVTDFNEIINQQRAWVDVWYDRDDNTQLTIGIENDASNLRMNYLGTVRTWPFYFFGHAGFSDGITVYGTKSRAAETDNYSDRLLYCYETPTPLFGDIGEAVIDEDGFGFVDIDDIFSETIAERCEYQVFLQKEGEGDCWISEKNQKYFVIQGTPGLKVAWELKAKQKDYQNIRLEQLDDNLETYSNEGADDLLNSHDISEMEDLLNDYY